MPCTSTSPTTARGRAAAPDGTFDIVLMDLQMPVMDGHAARGGRAVPGSRRLPIVAMTANAMAGDRGRWLEAGMNDHVAKPIEPDELFNVLPALASRSS